MRSHPQLVGYDWGILIGCLLGLALGILAGFFA